MLSHTLANGIRSTRFRFLLTLVVAATASQAAIAQEPRTPRPEFFPQRTAGEARIWEALASKTEIDFVETPLEEVVDYLKDLHHIEMLLDKSSFDEAGISSDKPMTARLRQLELGPALQLVLEQSELTYLVRDGYLLITTPEVAEAYTFNRVYPIGDLAANQDEFNALADALTMSVYPTTWRDVGGPGSIAYVPQVHSMIVGHNQDAHDEILRLLRALRAARRVSSDGGA